MHPASPASGTADSGLNRTPRAEPARDIAPRVRQSADAVVTIFRVRWARTHFADDLSCPFRRDVPTRGEIQTFDHAGSPVSLPILYGTSFVELVAVPEPATYALWLALVTVALVLWRHRRERRGRRET